MDGTLCNEQCWTPEECLKATPNPEYTARLNKDYQTAFIIIWTARKDEMIPATLEWLRRNNIRYHAISNLKMPADNYVDSINI